VSDQPGKLIGSGRAADVYDLGDGTVLRRYRAQVDDVEREAEVMRYVRSQGFPAPEVFSAAGTDLVMEKIEGRTMMAKLVDSPARVYSHGRLLARLLTALGEISAPNWLMAPGFAAHPSGDRVLHLDLHPMNVMITGKGPVVIDWTNAAGGPAGFDAAMTYVVMATYDTANQKEWLGQQVLVRSFRRARGRRVLDPFIATACDHRLADPGTSPEERVAVAELRAKVTRTDQE
jgi:aminoglycoside phosphotransferase (APT) family kinase protein